MKLRPRHIAERTSLTARRAGDYLRGERTPPLEALGEILAAFPELDARQFVRELLKASRASRGGPMTEVGPAVCERCGCTFGGGVVRAHACLNEAGERDGT